MMHVPPHNRRSPALWLLVLLALLTTLLPCCSTAALAQTQRLELGRRLKRFELAWEQAAPERRIEAVSPLKKAVSSFFSLQLSEAGWTANSIKAHERITVTGNPTWTGSARMAFLKLVRADGTELVSIGEQRVRSIEEERRQRAQQRSQQK